MLLLTRLVNRVLFRHAKFVVLWVRELGRKCLVCSSLARPGDQERGLGK